MCTTSTASATTVRRRPPLSQSDNGKSVCCHRVWGVIETSTSDEVRDERERLATLAQRQVSSSICASRPSTDLADGVIRAGLVILALTLGMGIDTLLWSTGEASGDWALRRRTASREFSKVMVVGSTVLGIPLVLGGLASLPGSNATVVWVVFGAGSMAGLGVVAWLWRRVPAMRLGAEFWDAEATIGSGGRRRGILILIASLLFTVIAGLALAINQ